MKTIKTFIIASYLLTTTYVSQAQITTSVINQRSYGGSLVEMPYCELKTADNGYIIGGGSYSGISGDKTEPSKGGGDLWIIRLNPDLSIRWQKTIGGSHEDFLTNLIECNDGGFVCIGGSSSPISGDKTDTCYGNYDFWVVKIDSIGNILWQNVYGGSGADYPSSIIRLTNGKYLIGGSSDSDSSGVKTEDSRGSYDSWIVCIDSLGNMLWNKTIGGSQSDGIGQLTQVSDNSILLAGTSFSPVSGEKTQPPIGSKDIWLVNIDINGNIIWDKVYGGNDIETNVSLCYKQNSLYIACYSFSGISGTKTEPCIGSCDYWILKLDVDGNKIWDKTIGGANDDITSSISISSDNELLIAGSSNSNISGNKTEASYGLSDMWVVAMDTNSNVTWQKTIGGSDYDGCYDLVEVANNNYMLFGYSNSGISGLKTDACRGEQDYWMVEIANDFGIRDNIKNDLKLSPNPFSQSTQITLNQTYQNIALAVYDIQGKQVAQQHYANCSQIQLNRNQLTNGLYFVKLTLDDKQVETVKIVIND